MDRDKGPEAEVLEMTMSDGLINRKADRRWMGAFDPMSGDGEGQ